MEEETNIIFIHIFSFVGVVAVAASYIGFWPIQFNLT